MTNKVFTAGGISLLLGIATMAVPLSTKLVTVGIILLISGVFILALEG